MRNLILAVTATATFAAMGLTAEAMPISGSVATAPQANPAIQKTEVIVRSVVRRPVVRRRCTTVITAGRRVTRCVVR